MEKTVESLVVKFDQAKYEEFLSFGSKSPRVAWQYRRVSSEAREANIIEGQSGHTLLLPQLQVTGGSQRPMQRNWNAERR